MSTNILAIDQGTSSSRALVVDRSGAVRSVAQREIALTYPHPGWVNQDPLEIWMTTRDVAREAIARSGAGVESIRAIGITNQRETTIVWERASGNPVAPAIVWQSRQSAEIIERVVRHGRADEIVRITGLTPDAYFSASKLSWLLERDPELRARAEAGELAFGTVDSWMVWNLTGGRHHVTDAANAARTMLFDIAANAWSDPLLDLFRIPRALLPTVVDNIGNGFETDPAVFGRAIPIAALAGDQHAALFGQACFAPGETKNTYGTGSFMLMNAGPMPVSSENKLLSTIAWREHGRTIYALEGAVFVTGSAVQWLRDGLGIIASAAEIEPLAASVPNSGGVVFVPALTGLGAPDWNPGARGTLLGLTRGTTRAHIARATLEGIACQTQDLIGAMERDSGLHVASLRVDGGAASNNLLMQMQADLLGVPVIRPEITETTAMGVAYMAGIGVGAWASHDEIRALWREDRRFEPNMNQKRREAIHRRWREAVSRSFDWSHWESECL
jgi:glycerol kinase